MALGSSRPNDPMYVSPKTCVVPKILLDGEIDLMHLRILHVGIKERK